ncbi:MAG: hypothetical protein CVU48_01985 [Candidatus Cloacimonetes bacterium HGW-Cloacimonetes-1]|jgi:hypothetical protein|nr:MAG: hypothetical protein CVU48_01985 [Candidatus Cloacimonetes bacterium HGW-Cloacimonetes-1]
MKIAKYIGDTKHDYRSIMRDQTDINLSGLIVPIDRLVICEQTHSELVHLCSELDAGAGIGSHPQIPIADGFVTNIPNLYLLIRTADCTPVLLWDETLNVIAAVHSGRESTRKDIVGNAIRLMVMHFQSSTEHIHASIGPGICSEHYEVSQQIYEEFQDSVSKKGIVMPNTTFRHLDIQGTILRQIVKCGVPIDNIEYVHKCTFESEDYFSFRRDGTKNRQINIIGITHE